jgi:hypothetical protein
VARCLSLVLSPLPLLACLLLPLGAGCGEASTSEAAGAALRFDACAPLVIALDANATEGQARGAQAALDLWNGRAATELALDATGAAAAPSVSYIPLRFQRAAAPSHGFYDPSAGVIFINEDLSGPAQSAALAITIAHEIGHAFGLAHVPDRASVMTAGNLDVEPNAGDVDALAAIWGRCQQR